MAVHKYSVTMDGKHLPVDSKQHKLATIYSRTPGEKTLPYPYWLQNVIPTALGYKSVSYQQMGELPVHDPAIKQNFPPMYLYLESSLAGTTQLYVDNNSIYIFDIGSNAWVTAHSITGAPDQITTAHVSDRSFVSDSRGEILELTGVTLPVVALNFGVSIATPSNIIGISSNSGYLLLYTKDTIYYSSPVDPTEFEISKASIITGAGSTKVQQLIGQIVIILPVAGGSLIYTTKNIVSMRYTGNVRNPWVFTELADSAGIVDINHVTVSPNGSAHYVWSTQGFLQVQLSKCTNILPEYTEFFSREVLQVEQTDGTVDLVSGEPLIKVTIIGGTHIGLSIGSVGRPFNAMWIYNITLGRWGRLQVDHWDARQFVPIVNIDKLTYDALIAKGWTWADLTDKTLNFLIGDVKNSAAQPLDMALVGTDNHMYHCDLAKVSTNADSEMLIGDIRITRNRACTVQLVEIQTDEALPTVTMRPQNQPDVDFIPNRYEEGTWVGLSTANRQVLKLSGDFIVSAIEVSLQDAGYSL